MITETLMDWEAFHKLTAMSIAMGTPRRLGMKRRSTGCTVSSPAWLSFCANSRLLFTCVELLHVWSVHHSVHQRQLVAMELRDGISATDEHTCGHTMRAGGKHTRVTVV